MAASLVLVVALTYLHQTPGPVVQTDPGSRQYGYGFGTSADVQVTSRMPLSPELRSALIAYNAAPTSADARQQLLAKEKAVMRERDALAAERRRMPWQAVDKQYVFEGPKGKASLLDLFEGRRQLIVYRAFFEPGVYGWPEHACRGCSFVADQVAHLAHLNARDTTLVFASRAPQADIERLLGSLDAAM